MRLLFPRRNVILTARNPMRGLVLKDNEVIVRMLRPCGWEYIFSWVCSAGFVGLAFFLLFPLAAMKEIGISIFIFLLVFGLGMFVRVLYLWGTNATIITNQRIISVKRTGPLTKAFSEVELGKIHDVSYSVHGLKQTLFGFGDIILQTSAIRQHQFVLATLRSPHEIQNLINELREKVVLHEVIKPAI